MTTFAREAKTQRDQTADLVLTAQEREELQLALESYLGDLSLEIAHTGGGDQARSPHGGAVMADVVYIAMAAGFFGLTWLLVKLCERL